MQAFKISKTKQEMKDDVPAVYGFDSHFCFFLLTMSFFIQDRGSQAKFIAQVRVIQGSVLSPLLYKIAIGALGALLKRKKAESGYNMEPIDRHKS